MNREMKIVDLTQSEANLLQSVLSSKIYAIENEINMIGDDITTDCLVKLMNRIIKIMDKIDEA